MHAYLCFSLDRSGGSGGGGDHMGNMEDILELTHARGTNNTDILKVINPPAAERERSHTAGSVILPGHAEYRMSPSIGCLLRPSQVVRSNHFRVDTTGIVEKYHHYHVHIYRFKRGVIHG